MLVVLPWPSRHLSPNARGHWAGLHRARKKARWDAAFVALEAMNGQAQTFRASFDGDEPIRLRVTFHPPDKRAHDLDNLVARAKAQMDGLADALAVNDRRFATEYLIGEPEKPGRVVVEL